MGRGLLSDVLPYIYSQGDRAKRYMNGLLADPVGTLQQTAGGIVDAGREQQGLLGRAFADPKKPFQVTDSGALNQAVGNVMAGPMGFAPAGIFAGVGAKTANKAALAEAQQRLSAGDDAAKVWAQTGWAKGPDGQMRFEIDDSASKLRDYNYTPAEAYQNARANAVSSTGSSETALPMAPYAGMTKNQLKAEYQRTGGKIVDAAKSGDMDGAKQLLQDRAGLDQIMSAMRDRTYGPASAYLSHGDLGAAYPDVYKLHTRIDSMLPKNALGQYQHGSPQQGEQIVMAKAPMWPDDKSTLLHELQHVVQQREGFASGGNTEMFNQAHEAQLARDALSFRREVDALGMPKDADWIAKENAVVQRYHDIGAPDWLPSPEARRLAGDTYNNPNEQLQELVNLYGLDKHVTPASPRNLYDRLAGEAEARMTQQRMNMTPQARAAQYPYDPAYFQQATGVPLDSLIFRK